MDGKQKRLTARRAIAEDLINGRYFRREGFKSNYLITPRGQRVSRIKMVATVTTKFVNDDGTYAFVVLDDGTETIRAKFFQDLENFEKLEEGDLVTVIGKVQEYEGEIYVNPEILKIVDDSNLLSLNLAEVASELKSLEDDRKRLEELRDKYPDNHEEVFAEEVGIERAEAILKSEELDREDFDEGEEADDEDKSELRKEVLDVIENIDEGEGASYQDIIDEVDAEENDIDSVVNDLLTEGTCFEPRPGKIKKL